MILPHNRLHQGSRIYLKVSPMSGSDAKAGRTHRRSNVLSFGGALIVASRAGGGWRWSEFSISGFGKYSGPKLALEIL